jgi:hypothetical protein
MTVDQIMAYVFAVAAQFGLDNAIRVVVFLLIAGVLMGIFLRLKG